MSREISNTDDIIDSRDVLARIEELESEREALVDAFTESAIEDNETDAAMILAARHAQAALAEWDSSDEGKELSSLRAFADEGNGEWKHGETLVRESYFKEYAQELADDIGAIPKDATWPMTCIDWDQAARELRYDYTGADFDGVTYYYRA